MFVSRVPGIWQRCSAAVLGEINVWRDIQWSTTQSWLCCDHRKVPEQMKPGGLQVFSLLHHHAKVSTQSGDLYSARCNWRHVQRSVEDRISCVCPETYLWKWYLLLQFHNLIRYWEKPINYLSKKNLLVQKDSIGTNLWGIKRFITIKIQKIIKV